MFERKYADAYEFNIEKIYEMLSSHIVNKEDFEYFCKEDVERMNVLTERINNIMALDEEFKKKFVSELNNTMCYVSSNSFDNGLRIGLSLLKNLLTAEPPEINAIHKEMSAKKDDFIEDFSRIYENLPLRERMYLMTRIYEYEEKYNEKIP